MPQAKKAWSVRKTLARSPVFRPIESEDERYVWAAYQAGSLSNLFPSGLAPDNFRTEFEHLILTRYDAAWTMFARTRRGTIPVGLALGFWPHPEAKGFLLIDALIWFPWSTPRNRIESAVNFVGKARHDFKMLAFARQKDKRLFEMLAHHGIVRRVGTAHNVFDGEPAAVWETRTNG